MKPEIPHSRPWVTDKDRERVIRSLDKKSISHWRNAQALAETLGCRIYASGTLALYAALNGLNLPPGTGVALPSFTCRDVLRAVRVAGLLPIVLDCDEQGLLDAVEVGRALEAGRIEAAVAVHQFGLINRALESLTHKLPIIEDCAHLPPGAYLEGSVAVVGSLEGTKLLGAGEGGYLIGGGENQGETLGRRISDLVASLALSQLERLEENLELRLEIAEQYLDAMGRDRVVNGERACWFRFLVRMDTHEAVLELIEAAARQGIVLRRPIMPLPLHGYEPSFKATCRVAETLWQRLVSIPLYPDLSDDEVSRVVRFLATQFI